MPTNRQLAANKKNAQKSTGPKTPEGITAVRLNGLKHGLTAATLILPGEKESDFDSVLAGFESEHQPSTPTEETLVRQMAMAQWRLRRLYHVEAAFFRLRLTDLHEEIEDDYDNKLTPIEQLALVAHSDRGKSSTLDNLSRLEARLERSFYKALHELQKMQKQSQSQNRTTPPDPIGTKLESSEPLPPLQNDAPHLHLVLPHALRDRSPSPGGEARPESLPGHERDR